jgi:hypothetical protein
MGGTKGVGLYKSIEDTAYTARYPFDSMGYFRGNLTLLDLNIYVEKVGLLLEAYSRKTGKGLPITHSHLPITRAIEYFKTIDI